MPRDADLGHTHPPKHNVTTRYFTLTAKRTLCRRVDSLPLTPLTHNNSPESLELHPRAAAPVTDDATVKDYKTTSFLLER